MDCMLLHMSLRTVNAVQVPKGALHAFILLLQLLIIHILFEETRIRSLVLVMHPSYFSEAQLALCLVSWCVDWV